MQTKHQSVTINCYVIVYSLEIGFHIHLLSDVPATWSLKVGFPTLKRKNNLKRASKQGTGNIHIITVLENRIPQVLLSLQVDFLTWIAKKGMSAEHKSHMSCWLIHPVEPALSQGAPKNPCLGQLDKCPSLPAQAEEWLLPTKRTNPHSTTIKGLEADLTTRLMLLFLLVETEDPQLFQNTEAPGQKAVC